MKWNKLFFIAILMLPILLIGTTLTSFHTPPGSPFSDLAISHYPNMYFLQQTMLVDHIIPLWNPNILGGYPFDADPLSGLWYPPGWISLLFTLPFGINLVILLHILAGGYGFYKYLKEVGYPEHISLLGMLCFVLMPKIYAHFGAGHVTLIYAFCLTPWLLWSEYLNGKKQVVFQSIIIAGVILADIRWLPYALLAWIANKIWLSIKNNQKRVLFRRGLSVIGFGLSLSAVFLLPFLQFVSLSTRTGMTSADTLYLSLPPEHLLGLFLQVSAGSPEWVVYLGGSLIFFGVISLINGQKAWAWIWALVTVLCLTWALGSSLPGMQYLAQLPGISSIRVPPRSMFLGNLAMIMLGVDGINSIITNDGIKKWKAIRLSGFGLLALITTTAIGVFFLAGKPNWVLWVSPFVLFVTFVAILKIRRSDYGHLRILALICLFIAVDLVIASTLQFEVSNSSKVASIDNEAVRTINENLHGGRIYTPSYSIPQDQAIERGWRLANGVHPLQLASYVSVLEAASGVPNTGYNVVQPPLENGDPFEDNRFAVPDPAWLATLNVSVVLSSFPINSTKLELLYQNQEIWIYRNPEYFLLPRMENDETSSIKKILEEQNDHIYEINTAGGTLITDWIDYPGWVITDNGKEVRAEVEMAFYKIKLDPGVHRIQASYRPYLMYLGLSITFMTIIALFLFSRFPRWQRQIN